MASTKWWRGESAHRHAALQRACTRRHHLAGVAATGVLLGACGPLARGEKPKAAGLAPAKLVWANWEDASVQGKMSEEMIQVFKSRFPNVDVQLVVRGYGDYVKAMWTELAAGTPADALYIPAGFYQGMLAQDALVSLEPYFKREPRGFWGYDFIPEVMDKAKWKGQVYGLPWDGANTVLHVNRDLFRKEGVPLPPTDWDDKSWTWDALLDRARALTKRVGGKLTQAGLAHSASFSYIAIWSFWAQNGAGLFNLQQTQFTAHQPEALEALEWWANARLRHQIMPTPQEVAAGEAPGDRSGNLAMWTGWAWNVQPPYEFDWGMYPLPRRKRAATFYHGHLGSIPKVSKVPDHAWELNKVTCGPEGLRIRGKWGLWAAPIIKGVELDIPVMKIPFAGYKHIPQGPLPYVPRWAEMEAPHNKALQEVADGKVPARQAMEALKAQIEPLLR